MYDPTGWAKFLSTFNRSPGTGKTLAYLIPAVEHVLKNPPPGIGVLIAAPSRNWAGS